MANERPLSRLSDRERIALTKLMDSIEDGNSQLPLTLVVVAVCALHRLVTEA